MSQAHNPAMNIEMMMGLNLDAQNEYLDPLTERYMQLTQMVQNLFQ